MIKIAHYVNLRGKTNKTDGNDQDGKIKKGVKKKYIYIYINN